MVDNNVDDMFNILIKSRVAFISFSIAGDADFVLSSESREVKRRALLQLTPKYVGRCNLAIILLHDFFEPREESSPLRQAVVPVDLVDILWRVWYLYSGQRTCHSDSSPCD